MWIWSHIDIILVDIVHSYSIIHCQLDMSSNVGFLCNLTANSWFAINPLRFTWQRFGAMLEESKNPDTITVNEILLFTFLQHSHHDVNQEYFSHTIIYNVTTCHNFEVVIILLFSRNWCSWRWPTWQLSCYWAGNVHL